MSRRTRAALAIARLAAYFAPDEHGFQPHVRMPRIRRRKAAKGDHAQERERCRRQIEHGILRPTVTP